MIRNTAPFSMTLLLLAMYHGLAAGQAVTTSILTIRVENQVEYVQDASDPSKFASIPDITTPVGSQNNFAVVTIIGDIVSVNGQPAKGVYIGRTRLLLLRPSPTPGQAIADAPRTAMREVIFEILKSDGTPIGSIVGLGFSGGTPPPGAPWYKEEVAGQSWGAQELSLARAASSVGLKLQARETLLVWRR